MREVRDEENERSVERTLDGHHGGKPEIEIKVSRTRLRTIASRLSSSNDVAAKHLRPTHNSGWGRERSQ